jgi:hypothetical protein
LRWFSNSIAPPSQQHREDINMAVAVSNIAGLVGGTFPLLLGVVAVRWDLVSAMWLCNVARILRSRQGPSSDNDQ